MTIELGAESFRAAERLAAQRTRLEKSADRAAAAEALALARDRFVEGASSRYHSGSHVSLRDCDRLERIAKLLVAFLDSLEREFDRLDIARDLSAWNGPDGLRIERSRWRRAEHAGLLAEAFHDLLNGPGAAVLAAACRREASA